MCSGRRLGTTGKRIKGWRRLSHHGASPEVVREQSRPLPILQYPRLLAYGACFDQDGNTLTLRSDDHHDAATPRSMTSLISPAVSGNERTERRRLLIRPCLISRF